MAQPLFSNAPVMPQAPTIPVMPNGSNMAAAMMRTAPLSLPTPSMGVPLSTMMALNNWGNPTANAAQGATAQQPPAMPAPASPPWWQQIANGLTGGPGTPSPGSPGPATAIFPQGGGQ